MHSFTQYHTILKKFHACWTFSAIFGPVSTCWVSKCMCLSWASQWWYFPILSRNFHTILAVSAIFGLISACSKVTLSNTPSCNFTQFSHNCTHFWLFQPTLGQFRHDSYQKACTQADKFIGGIGRGHRPPDDTKGKKGQRPPQELDFLTQHAKTF